MQAYGKVRPLSFDREGQNQPLLSSSATPWAGLPFEVHETPEIDGPWDGGPLPGERGMLVPIEGKRVFQLQLGGRQVTLEVDPGSVGLSDGDQLIRAERVSGHGKAVAFDILPVWYGRMVAEGGPASFAHLPPLAASETVLLLVAAMCAEVRSGANSGALLAETLSLALLYYVVERMTPKPMRVRGALAPGQQRRLLRYIDERLHEDLTLAEIAELVGVRPRQFTTLFRRAFGMSPHRFVIERRLQRGARLLAESRVDIAEIALHVGFSSPSHFSEAFRKRFGVSPRQYVLDRRFTIAGSR